MGEGNKRLLQLQQISIDLRDQMAEVHRLRSTLQLAENARRGRNGQNGYVQPRIVFSPSPNASEG
jgi:hypothetical protein